MWSTLQEIVQVFVRDYRRSLLIGGLSAVLVIVVLAVVVGSAPDQEPLGGGRIYSDKVEHVYSGHAIKLKTGAHVNYAGIRAPYAEEPLYEAARERNIELVNGRRVRLRFDDGADIKDERLRAYVFSKKGFVNELLVFEGLAYVRVTPSETRFSERLLKAQREAIRKERGVWGHRARSKERKYPADPKYGNFHRPRCEEVPKINPERLETFRTVADAVAAGLAPCNKCRPRQ